ncbi:MAG: hypothetical protein R6W76_23820, partial [Caldilinea sp.]
MGHTLSAERQAHDVVENQGSASVASASRTRALAGIARDALDMAPPLYVQSILGPARTWLPPYRRFSEFSLLNPWRPLRTLKFLQN